jgi:hypothetical protein
MKIALSVIAVVLALVAALGLGGEAVVLLALAVVALAVAQVAG